MSRARPGWREAGLLGWLLGRARPAPPTRPAAGTAPAPRPEGPPIDLRRLGEFPRTEFDPVDPQGEADLRREVLWAARSHDDAVPAFPQIAARILDHARDPDVDLDALVRLLQQEPAIAAQVLRFANSPLYARDRVVESLRDAVYRLGLREVTQIAATASLLALADAEAQAAGDRFARPWARLRRHSVVSAFAASWLALENGRVPSDRAFLAGLLHDVGKTVVLRALSVLDPGNAEPVDEHRLAAVMEGVHTRTGPAALRRWGLPDWLAAVAEHHHDAALPPSADAALVHMVRAASGVDDLRSNPHHRADLPDEVQASFDALALTQARRRAFIAQVAELAARADALLR